MIEIRKAAETDYDFTYEAKKLGYKAHVETIWGQWDEDWQQEEHRKDFDSGLLQIITLDNERAGYAYIRSNPETLLLADICILPRYQGHGIGTHIIEDLLSKAKALGIPLELGVFKINYSAIRLYKKLGFRQISETSTHAIMRSSKE